MSSTIEMQRQKVEQEMTKMVDNLDKTILRKIQVRELNCSINYNQKISFIYLISK